MGAFEKALEQIRGYSWIKVPCLPIIERYVQTGDAKALASLKPVGQHGSFWGGTLAGALSRPSTWSDQDRRIVHVLAALDLLDDIFSRMDQHLATEEPGEDLLTPVLREIPGKNRKVIAPLVAVKLTNRSRAGKPTSAGRFLLSLSDDELKSAARYSITQYCYFVAQFLAEFAGNRFLPIALHLLDEAEPERLAVLSGILLEKRGSECEAAVLKRFRTLTDRDKQFRVGVALATFDKKHSTEVLKVGRAALSSPGFNDTHSSVSLWMIEHFPEETVSDIEHVIDRHVKQCEYHKREVIQAAAAALGKKAAPILLAALQPPVAETKLDALPHLIALKDDSHDKIIHTEIERGFADPSPGNVTRFIGLAARWKPESLEKELWALLYHKSKPVRASAARALARSGEPVVPNAVHLFGERKADPRMAAVILLTTINSPSALKALEARLDEETDDDVRDAILRSLGNAWEQSGKKISLKEIRGRMTRCADKFKDLPAKWIRFEKLPKLNYADGKGMTPDEVKYLLYRQSRAREIAADLEAKPLIALIDRATSGDFALEVLKGFIASGSDANDRWALGLAGVLGDDRVVSLLIPQIRTWADKSRGKLAEYAVQALALLGTDQALLAVDAIAIRYRTKNKNIGKAATEAFAAAAEAAGLTPDELGDRVVPWLGFEPGKTRVVEAAKKQIQVSIGLDFKLSFQDVEAKKRMASLPKTAPKETLEDFKELGASLREVAKAQILRLENLMVRQRRWPAQTWREMFLSNPLLVPFAVRLVWGAYGSGAKLVGSFRALEDRTLADAEDNAFDLPGNATVGIVHPLEVVEELRKTWVTHLADHEVEPPFPQLERTVVLPKPEEHSLRAYKTLSGTSLNAMTFKGRAERLGWSRGSVNDGGSIAAYWKRFPAVGVDVMVGVEGMYIGIDMYSSITLGSASFVRSGSVKIGSYTYDDPGNETDERVMSFGEVPPIVFSEAMGDLKKIAGDNKEKQEV